MTNNKPRVLIIGAGLGGLTLAQALRRKGIPFEIFERDESPTARPQGWCLSLHPEMVTRLKESLPHDMPDLAPVDHLYNHGLSNEFAIFSNPSSTPVEVMRLGPEHGTAMIRADRQRLREWLLHNIPVHWNKRFKHYEEDAAGITASFEDGETFSGDVLVGADGVHSRVRDQMLPDPTLRPRPLPLGGIYGLVTATEEQYKRWMGVAKSLFVGADESHRVTVALKSIAADKKSAEYYWLFGWGDEKAVEEEYWTTKASKEELHAFVMGQADKVHPYWGDVFRATGVEGMLQPPLRLQDMIPPELPRGRVTLMGDSCHAMVPFRGQGGNMAMIDGMSLAKSISEASEVAVGEALKEYEAEMRPRATDAVLASRAASKSSAVNTEDAALKVSKEAA